jgi:hypothetical protein
MKKLLLLKLKQSVNENMKEFRMDDSLILSVYSLDGSY